MRIRQWYVYLVDLNPKSGTKPGKIRPCLCIQPDAFFALGSSVIIPFTSQLPENVEDYFPVRLRVQSGIAGLQVTSDLLVDQLQAWDHKKFVTELGILPEALQRDVRFALKEFLDI